MMSHLIAGKHLVGKGSRFWQHSIGALLYKSRTVKRNYSWLSYKEPRTANWIYSPATKRFFSTAASAIGEIKMNTTTNLLKATDKKGALTQQQQGSPEEEIIAKLKAEVAVLKLALLFMCLMSIVTIFAYCLGFWLSIRSRRGS